MNYTEDKLFERVTLKQACVIWKKPSYSTLSKKLPKIGYNHAVKIGLIPKYEKVGGIYLFLILDIHNWLSKTSER